MSVAKALLKWWVPVVVWMAVIYTASNDSGSGQRSSRIIGPILLWLVPDLSPEMMDFWVTLVRKCAHMAEFGTLALLFWRALVRPIRVGGRPWRWSLAGWAYLATCLYAMSDELHQMFVPSRQASWTDVMIDSAGALFALLLLWRWVVRRRQETPVLASAQESQ